jgi:hypothetical protein
MILIRTHADTTLSIKEKYRKYLSEHPGRHSEHLIDTIIIEKRNFIFKENLC